MPPAPTAPPPSRPPAPSASEPSYNPANQPSTRGNRAPSPDLTAALNRAAGVTAPPAPAPAPSSDKPNTPPPRLGEPGNEAAPPAASTAPAPSAPPDDLPAPHVKFIAADDRDEPAAPAAAPAPPEPEPTAPKELRAAFNRVRDERDSILKERDLTRKEAAEYRAKLSALEERAKFLEADSTRAKELEARVSQLDEQLRIENYLKHPEFEEKYTKPLNAAFASAIELVQQLEVNENGTPRMGTQQDFESILAMPNQTAAANKARELFGEDPTIISAVTNQRLAVRAVNRTRQEAMKNAALDSMKHIEQRQAAELRARTEARTLFDRASAALSAKHASLYLPPEGDREAAEARRSGEELAASVLLGTTDPLPQDQYLSNVAKVHHRAAAFPMLQLKYQRLEAERDALKEKLAAYEASTPEVRGRNGSDGSLAPGAAPNDYRAQMRAALEAKSREGGGRR